MFEENKLDVAAQYEVLKKDQYNPTILQNIDYRIKRLQDEIARLEESKITLAPILNARIGDIRDAMNY